MGVGRRVFARRRADRHRRPGRQGDRLATRPGRSRAQRRRYGRAHAVHAAPRPRLRGASSRRDGQPVATAGYDGRVLLWDPDEVQPIDVEARGIDEPARPAGAVPRARRPSRPGAHARPSPPTARRSPAAGRTTWSSFGTSPTAQAARSSFAATPATCAAARSRRTASCCFGGPRRADQAVASRQLRRDARARPPTRREATPMLAARFSPDGTQRRHRQPRSHRVAVGRRRRWSALQRFQEGHDFLASVGRVLRRRHAAGHRRRRRHRAPVGRRDRRRDPAARRHGPHRRARRVATTAR